MKIAIIGVGLAGSKIAEAMIEYAARTDSDFVAGALAVNTARADLLALERIPMENRILVGESRVKGNGAGSDSELGAEIAREDRGEVLGAVGEIPVEKTDAFLVVAGLGGGTGGGGAPVVAEAIRRVYTEPVYGLGVLPSRDEGGLYQLNAARAFTRLYDEVTNLLVLDNNAWWEPGGGSLQTSYDYINGEVARRIGLLLMASEAPTGVAPEMMVDASEVINTLAGSGVSTLGYAASTVYPERAGLLDRLLSRRPPEFEGEPVSLVVSTVRRATLGRLTLPCDVRGTRRALLVVAGPPDLISRKGLQRGIEWLGSETGTMEVRGGDFPLPGERKLAAIVLLSGVTDVPRLEEIRETAIETRRNIESLRETDPGAFPGVEVPEEELELPFETDD